MPESLRDRLQQLREEHATLEPRDLCIHPQLVVALVETAEAAEEHYDSWAEDKGHYQDGQRILRAHKVMEKALVRLDDTLKETP